MQANTTLDAVDARAPAPAARGVRDQLGDAIGRWLSPVVATLSSLRRARMFHPDGALYEAQLEATANSGPYAELAHRLGRTVLVRVSPALWRDGRERFEVLGIALRFHRGARLSTRVAPTDQDLLLATIASPLTMALSPFTTNAHDFLANRYYAVSPFAFGGDHRIQIRMTPIAHAVGDGPRAGRLATAVAAHEAAFRIEVRPTLTLRWQPIATLKLVRPLDLDQAALRFDPFQAGEGLNPVGTIHAIRRAVYAASQRARAAVGKPRTSS
jgi:hypothetical protein